MPDQRCPDTQQLQELLAEKLGASAVAELSVHVEACPACQKTLESLSPMSRSWTDVLAGIACDEPLPEPGLERVMKTASAPAGGETQAEPSAAARDEGLSFLAPSTRPGHLGRLGHYEVLNVIGKGGFGTVFRAFDEKLHRVVAVKVLAPELAASGTACKRFIREAQAAAAVKNEHVVAIYNVEDDHRPPYLVMELIDGISLEDRLKNEGPLELKEILRIGMQMAEGLAAAHKQGLIHRDIKPGNILLENGVQRVKITDFGLARAADDASVTQSGVIAGTPMFMAPEQAMGEKLDHPADLFSLGSVLYVMCTGRAPFRASTTMAVLKRVCDETPTPIREINPEVPDWLCAIVAKLQAKKADDRFGSTREVAELLGKYLAEVQAHGRAGSVSDRSEPSSTIAPTPVAHAPGSPKRALFALVIASVVGIAAFLAVVYWPRSANVPEKKEPIAKKEPPEELGWVQLFNGTDLTGWKSKPLDAWKVDKGILSNLEPGAYLFPDKAHRLYPCRNFHYRVELKMGAGAAAGLVVRARPSEGAGVLLGTMYGGKARSGSIYQNKLSAKDSNGRTELVAVCAEEHAKTDAWFVAEVLVRGQEVVARINGVETARHTLVDLPDEGDVGISVGKGSKGTIHVRKIEIKELPPPPAPKDEWVQLFNGKDLTGWSLGKETSGIWTVDDGRIVGKGHQAWLMTERSDFRDFHLRMQTKYVHGAAQLVLRGQGERSAEGYWLFMNNDRGNMHTGALMTSVDLKAHTTIVREERTRPNEWFTLEVIARGKHFQTFVNGEQALDWTDPSPRNVTQGSLRFYVLGKDAEIQVKKIEIKELPPTLELPPAKKLTPEQEDEVKTLVSQGNIAGRKNMLTDAVRLGTEALAIDPRSVPAYTLRSTAYDAMGRYDKSIEDATIGLMLDAENLQLYVNRTNGYVNTEQYEKAIADATRLLELKPTYKNAPQARANRGVAYAATGETKKALQDFDIAVKTLPVALLYWHRSFVHMRLGNKAEAEADRKQAIELDPTFAGKSPPAWWSRSGDHK